MFGTKLIDIYSNLNLEEKRKLRKWISSDFVNKNEDILRFFEFIDSKKNVTERTVTKEKAHEYLYPNKKYHDLRIRHLIWMTTEILESFIVYIKMENELSLREQLLSKFYMQKDLYKHAQKTVESGIELMAKNNIKNAEYYKTNFHLHSLYYDIQSRNIRTNDFNIDEIANSFTIFAILETLKTSSRILSIQKVGETKTKHHLLEPILVLMQDPAFLQLPQVRIYYNIYLVATNEDEKAFKQFIKDIKANEILFSTHDLNELYRLAINFCIKKSNQNQTFYTKQALDLYLYTIDKSILIENNEISRFIFTNVVTLGIKLKKFARIEEFIKMYSKLINPEFRKNTIDFNTSKLLYAKGQSDKALKILLTNEFKDTIWNLNAKDLILRIYFEQKNIELFSTYLNAFNVYVKRKTNIGYHKTYFTHLIALFKELYKATKQPKKYAGFVFTSEMINVTWFNNMLAEMNINKKAPK
ncbi:MAG: hypothetical protein U0U67_05065 [Chitinophagales bacterium]